MSKHRGGKATSAKGEQQQQQQQSNPSSGGGVKLDESQKEERIATVSAVTGWPNEDVKRVLEDSNWNTDLATSNILDGFAGKPHENWQTASNKRSAVKDKDQKAKDKAAASSNTAFRRSNATPTNRDNNNNQAGNRRANLPTERRDKSKGQGPKQQNTVDTTGKENGQVSLPANIRPSETAPTTTKEEPEKSVENKVTAPSIPPSTVVSQQPQQTTSAQPSTTPQQVVQPQKGSPKDQQRAPVTRPQQPQQQAQNPPAQKTQAAQPPVQQPAQSAQSSPITQADIQSTTTTNATSAQTTSSQQQTTPSSSSSSSSSAYSSKAYFPASMVWKPRNGQPSSPQVPAASSISQQTPQPVPTTAAPAVTTVKSTPSVIQPAQQQSTSPVTTAAAAAAQPSATTQPSVTTISSHPSYTGTSMYSNSPVTLPAKANEHIQDIAFGTLGITQSDYDNTSQYLNASDLSSKSNISSAASQTYIDSSATGERADHTRVGQYGPLESEGHPIHPYTYMPPFMYPYSPMYEAGIYEQQGFPAQQPYQREPSPSESAKFSASQRGSANSQQYRDPKYSTQDGSVSQQQTTSSPQLAQAQQQQQQQPSPSSPVQQQHFYGSPMYGYPPYLPNQYSYQTAQAASQYYRHPYMTRYPNFSASSGTFPPGPSATASSIATGYPEDLNQDYSKFPYYSPEMSTMMSGTKAPQQVGQQQTTTTTAAAKGQSYPQQPSQNTQDLSSASYKPTQQPDYSKAYQNSSYYNIAQQYGQTNQTNYPFLQQPQSQQAQTQQYSRQQTQPQQTYLPENKNF